MITLTLTANAGILIQTQDKRLLLDGIQDGGGFPFSGMPAALWTQMLSYGADGLCNNVDYLVFSHMHPDHFSPRLTAEYLICNRVRRILMPDSDAPSMQPLSRMLSKTGALFWTFPLDRGSIRQFRFTKDISVTVLCTRHMSQLFAKDICSALLFHISGRNILFLTDCSCREEQLFGPFYDLSVDVAFVNPYFYHDPEGRRILSSYIRPRQTVIYHIPFPEDDTIQIRSLAKQDVKKYPGEGLTLFQEPFQSLTLS